MESVCNCRKRNMLVPDTEKKSHCKFIMSSPKSRFSFRDCFMNVALPSKTTQSVFGLRRVDDTIMGYILFTTIVRYTDTSIIVLADLLELLELCSADLLEALEHCVISSYCMFLIASVIFSAERDVLLLRFHVFPSFPE